MHFPCGALPIGFPAKRRFSERPLGLHAAGRKLRCHFLRGFCVSFSSRFLEVLRSFRILSRNVQPTRQDTCCPSTQRISSAHECAICTPHRSDNLVIETVPILRRYMRTMLLPINFGSVVIAMGSLGSGYQHLWVRAPLLLRLFQVRSHFTSNHRDAPRAAVAQRLDDFALRFMRAFFACTGSNNHGRDFQVLRRSQFFGAKANEIDVCMGNDAAHAVVVQGCDTTLG
eukprot:7121215-Prymnesium_polylepis.1